MAHVRRQHWATADQYRRSRGLLAVDMDSAEDEADAGSLAIMVAAGFNPHVMHNFPKVILKVWPDPVGGYGGSVYIEDNPLTSERIKKTIEYISAYGNRQFPTVTPMAITQAGASLPPLLTLSTPL